MSCADDLTVDDLNDSSATAVLERVTAGQGSNTSLWAFIDRDGVTGVNLQDPTAAPKIIKTWDNRFNEEGVESGVDDELILHIPFTQSLRLRTLLLNTPGPSHPNRAGRLRLFANLPNCPDFADLNDMTPIMDLDTSSPPPTARRGPDGTREVEEWSLKVQKLANVHSATLLFSEAVSERRTAVWYVGFKGDPKTMTMDMSRLGKVEAQNSAENPVDQAKQSQGSGYTTIR
ncbi:galactose-binding domain-like protein [Kockovaella imperatae]|uniref:Galactose-binding domain-like protein n=1 Tax=Kockovaella imperatae TaxID=4999 RepID=A0A1Y1U860_9TREE|nr:galactose-binding domain-like protein [Kockovaella imperatae]ORX34198.1 galactose-binding domain-like protein [Kockovaella imperatae]